jgi:plastocyanin
MQPGEGRCNTFLQSKKPYLTRETLVLLLLIIVSSCGKQLPSTEKSKVAGEPVSATISITKEQELFKPFILAIQPHTTIIWQNSDKVAHRVTTTPQKQSYLNPQSFTLSIGANKSGTLKLDTPGIYHYYEPEKASWQEHFSRAVANKGEMAYPLAMDGVIWVQGTIAGLPDAALNEIRAGHDEFEEEFLAIRAPGSVAWHNFDEDPHFIGEVPNWEAPINPNDIGIYRLAGTADVRGGQTISIAFNTPGLYYYYCRNHDHINEENMRTQALKKASEYPMPMEGFVLVV